MTSASLDPPSSDVSASVIAPSSVKAGQHAARSAAGSARTWPGAEASALDAAREAT